MLGMILHDDDDDDEAVTAWSGCRFIGWFLVSARNSSNFDRFFPVVAGNLLDAFMMALLIDGCSGVGVSGLRDDANCGGVKSCLELLGR